MTESKLCVWRSDEDWVVAASAEDAVVVCREYLGERQVDAYGTRPEHWRKQGDGKWLTVHLDDGSGVQTRTCGEWAQNQGRGFLASENY